MKFLGYDYTIYYKKGKDNVVIVALSRKQEPIQLFSISGVQFQRLDAVKNSWNQDTKLQQLVQSIQAGKNPKSYYKYQAGILSMKGRMMVRNVSELKIKLISFYQ